MRTLSAIVLGLFISTAATAQSRSTELAVGITGIGVQITGGQSLFTFDVNSPSVAIGFYPAANVAIEPSIGISVLSGGGASVSVVDLGLAVPIYSKATWGHSGLFVAPGLGVSVLSAGASGTGASLSQFSLGLSVGTKVRLAAPVSLSVSGGFAYGFATAKVNDAVVLRAQLGVSVFL